MRRSRNSAADAERSYEVGYGKAPAETRFKKGQSGNPRGRPRDKRKTAPYEAVLGQMVTVAMDGHSVRVTAAEAFLLHLTKTGLGGDVGANQAALSALETARQARSEIGDDPIHRIVICPVSPECANMELRDLKMAVKVDAFRPTARMLLEPWIVEAALARLGERRLNPAEQLTVWRATRTPRKVRWPGWWNIPEADLT